MKIGVVIAMSEELNAFLAVFPNYHQKNLKQLPYWKIDYREHTINIIKCGIGKVNAAYATTLLLNHEPIDLIFNIGVAGGINIAHEALLIADQVLYHDVDVSEFSDYVLGQVPKFPPTFKTDETFVAKTRKTAERLQLKTYKGFIASGDQFMTNLDKLVPILKLYPTIVAIEMEAAGIAQIASLEKVPFVAIKAISDIVGDGKQNLDFASFLLKASTSVAYLLKGVIDDL